MIKTNYAGIRDRGTDLMYANVLYDLNAAVRRWPNGVVVMGDYTGYFASISTSRLRESVFERHIEDPRVVALIMLFFPGAYGCSLGNELSQVPASFYPSPVDHYFKDKRGVKYYHRYMDDSLAILPNAAAARQYALAYEWRSSLLELKTGGKKIVTVPLRRNFIFCKKRYIYDADHAYYYMLLNPKMEANEARKIKKLGSLYRDGSISRREVEQQYKGAAGAILCHKGAHKAGERLAALYKEHVGEEPPEVREKLRGPAKKKKSVPMETEGKTTEQLVTNSDISFDMR